MTAENPEANDFIAVGLVASGLSGLPMPDLAVLSAADVRQIAYILTGIASGFAAVLQDMGIDAIAALENIVGHTAEMN